MTIKIKRDERQVFENVSNWALAHFPLGNRQNVPPARAKMADCPVYPAGYIEVRYKSCQISGCNAITEKR
ncbi:MAG: hypothetical protein SAK29_01325 [Scytonema sp. PMC 1069.18]|nr:hypothetical protein [Scytonema sp. PMC 1069.18]MEC4880167.1 hypothetical protein [Scytonema sp. PMC 1070.18]